MTVSLDGLDPRPWNELLRGAEYCEAYLEESAGSSIQFEDSRVEQITAGSDQGVGLRFLRVDPRSRSAQTTFGSLNTLEPGAARSLGRRLVEFGKTVNGAKPLGNLESHRHLVVRDPSQVPVEAKIKMLAEVDRIVRSEFPSVRQVSLTCGERHKTFAVLNSEGLCHREERRTVLFAVRITAEKGGMLQTGYEVIGALKGWELFGEVAPVALGRAAARRAVTKLECPQAKAGDMPVILASSAGGTFVHEAIGHSLEADHVQEGTSPAYRNKLGQTVAREFLSIVDDPTLPLYRGSYRRDDEGSEARPTLLVERGVLKTYLYDRVTALKDGAASNGHGRRESYHHKPIPRMSNLYIVPGSEDPRRIVQELDRGLLVTKMGGGQVDTATGEFIFEVEEGFWVESGVVRHMVRDANLLGVGPEVLRSIDRLGWDIGWGIGTCGKQGQGVPVSDGQPTLRIPKLLVGGRES
ncbi:MAG: TldD/PmbA family protein [Elusimicrobia bacterium]|nr:TldD/PmbA family protein [Elusimicrobiota bacterium]